MPTIVMRIPKRQEIAVDGRRQISEALRELGGGQMVRVPTFDYLTRLYEREGLYEDALDIAKRGAALEQGEADVTRLEQLVRGLQEEDAG